MGVADIMISKLRSLYEKSPQHVRSFFNILPQYIEFSHVFRRTARQLQEYDEYNSEFALSLQRKKLSSLLYYSIKNVPFYQDIASKWLDSQHIINEPFEVLRDFPILSKENLINDGDKFISRVCPKSKRYTATTGGSTGRPISIQISDSMWSSEWAYVYNLLREFGVTPSHRRVSFRGTSNLDLSTSRPFQENPVYKELRVSPFFLSENNTHDILTKWYSFNPTFVHGYPSAIKDFIGLLSEDECEKIFHNIRVILLVSENIQYKEMRQIEKITKTPVTSFYGHTERACFAPWKREQKLWVPEWSYGVSELRNNKLVVTGFHNLAMPLIRYDTDDAVSCSLFSDGTLSPFSGFESIMGRWSSDFLIGAGGQKITMTALNVHSEIMNKVGKYQLVQNKLGEAELRIVIRDEVNRNSIAKKVYEEFQNKCGESLKLNYKIVSEIPLTSIGKHRFLVRE